MAIRKIYLIHHSHTDIGYTAKQEKIFKHQAGYIRQVMGFLRQAKNGSKHPYKGFVWTCETFGVVEGFWRGASPEEKAEFINYVKTGEISLSANYLNMTELAGKQLFRSILGRAESFAAEHGLTIDSALTADVNGYSWNNAQSLYDIGVRNFCFCLHDHHGMISTWRKQYPFWWELPQSSPQKPQRLLIWNAEHYMEGNRLGLMPDDSFSLEWKAKLEQNELQVGEGLKEEEASVVKRLEDYIHALEGEAYPFSIVPINASGIYTDNAPPNPLVCNHLRKLNDLLKDSGFEVELVGLATFFARFRELYAESSEIPVYSGDWPDWWSDGVGSTAEYTKLFRDAQRKYEQLSLLGTAPEKLRDLEEMLFFYAEHTWGYHASIRKPHSMKTLEQASRKLFYSIQACKIADELLEEACAECGDLGFRAQHEMRFKVLNPYEIAFRGVVRFAIDGSSIQRLKNGAVIVSEGASESRGYFFDVADEWPYIIGIVEVPAKGELTVQLQPLEKKVESQWRPSFPVGNAPHLSDIRPRPEDLLEQSFGSKKVSTLTSSSLHSPSCSLAWDARGIFSLKLGGKEQLTVKKLGMLSPLSEITQPLGGQDYSSVRTVMGRNRKGWNTEQYFGKLEKLRPLQNNEFLSELEFSFSLEQSLYCKMQVIVYHQLKRIDFSVNLAKNLNLAPESVFFALPFELEGRRLRLEKAGILMEPWKDQLPGSLTDFYCIQNSIHIDDGREGLVLVCYDAPLLQVGTLNFEDRLLHGHPELEQRAKELYSWPLNTIWETNFKADCAGFHEFRYSVLWGPEFRDEAYSIEMARLVSTELPNFIVG